MAVLSKIVSFLISILFAVTGVVSPVLSQQVKSKDEKALRLSFATFSDTHLTDDGVARQTMLSQGFRDLDGKVDAIAVVGDLTDHGERKQFENFYSCVKKNVKDSTLIPVVGNHDTWTKKKRNKKPTEEFIRAYNKYSGKKLKTPYYTQKVNGYTFIVMSSEKDETYAVISNKQIKWLDKELKKATKGGRPAFVMCHWPINGVCGQEKIDPDMKMGKQSKAVKKVLQKYDNVFFFCGHVHAGLRGELSEKLFSHQSIETHNGVHYINLPSYMYMNTEPWENGNGGNLLSGCGYIAEVYKNKVVLRARNYALGFYMPEYEKTIKLVK